MPKRGPWISLLWAIVGLMQGGLALAAWNQGSPVWGVHRVMTLVSFLLAWQRRHR